MRARIPGFVLILDGTVGAVFWLVVFESSSRVTVLEFRRHRPDACTASSCGVKEHQRVHIWDRATGPGDLPLPRLISDTARLTRPRQQDLGVSG